MRKLLIVLSSLLLSAGGAAAQRQEVDRKIWVAPQGFIRLFVHSGAIRIHGWDQDSMSITGTLSTAGAGEFVVAPGKQGAKASVWGSTSHEASALLLVRVPRRSQLWVKTQDADVAIFDFEGGIDVMTIAGDVEIAGRPREVYAETMGGDVNLGVVSRSARVKTGAGVVTLRGVYDEATISSVSGAIFAIDTRIKQGRFESVDGRISYQGDLAAPGRLEFINHAGAVDLLLPSSVSGIFSVSTFEGMLRDEFGLRIRHGAGKLKAREFSFSLGSLPDNEVSVRTFKGIVTIRKLGGKPKA